MLFRSAAPMGGPADLKSLDSEDAVGTGTAAAVRRAPATAREGTTRETTTPDRTFAAPLPTKPRSDFRDTLYWAPSVHTGTDGTATVRFSLNDAVSSFRATVEGLGAGRVGSGEALITSALPFHLETRLPVALSTGDHLELPITLENQRSSALAVALSARVGDLLGLGALVAAWRREGR